MSNIITMKYINNVGIKDLVYENKNGRKIYLLNNGYKFKEFPQTQRPLSNPDNLFVYNNLIEQSKIDLETIDVPKGIVADDNNVYGYIAPFFEGIPISEIDPEFLITELFNILDKIESDVIVLSREGWYLEDLHDQNLLINKSLSTGKIIDLDDSLKTKERAIQKNMLLIFNVIIYSILPRIQLSKAFKKDVVQQYFLMASQGLTSTSEFLRHLLAALKIRIITGVTIEDIRKKL